MLEASPVSEWGAIQAAEASRYELFTSGGDPWLMGNGEKQPNAHFRRLQLHELDRFLETCRTEVGANESRNGTTGGTGTFMLYQEKTLRHTFFSQRLASTFPISTGYFQDVMQMKQTQPYTKGNAKAVMILMAARENQWQMCTAPELQEDPFMTVAAVVEQWVRFHYEVYYNPTGTGWLKVYVDNRTGLAENSAFVPQHTSEQFFAPEGTLDTANGEQTTGSPPVTYTNGQPIPGHLRMGIYRDTRVTGNTSIDIANVQVFEEEATTVENKQKPWEVFTLGPRAK